MKRKKTQQPIKSKSGLWIMIVAACALEAISCTMYFTSHHAIRNEAEQRAKVELRKAELEIELRTIEMETAAKTLALLAEKHLNTPDSIYADTRMVVRSLREYTSMAVAFVPDYYPKQGRYLEICGSRISEDSVYTRQIGSAEHDYTQMEWFLNGLTIDSCWWCEPYMDDSGSQAKVVSCSCPIHDKNGKVVAVVCVDLSLDYLRDLSENLKVYPNSYSSIRSSKGVDIVTAPDTTAGRKYNIFNEEIDATGWHIEIIIPEEVLFADLNRIGRIVGILMLIGLIALGLIIWHTTRTVRQLIATRAQNQRMESELEIARAIQMAMLPKTFPPTENRKDLSMYGLVLPAREVGGDLYDFYERDNKLYFCVGDVSGKGVPASLVMAVTRALFRSLSVHEHDVAVLTSQINNALSETNEMNMFVTLFIGIMDLKTGELHYCNAGHNAPVLIERNHQAVEKLPTIPNLPIGILSGYAYTPQTATMQRGDMLFLYTDGLTEAENAQHELFGEQRMLDTLTKAENAQKTVETLLAAVQTFVGDAEQSDDLTMLAFQWMETGTDPTEAALPLKHSIVMRNDIQQIPTLAEWVESLQIPEALNMTINLALEEAVTNVMLYAYPDQNGKVLIEAEKSAEQITFVISDNGIPFDPTQKPEADITLSAEERAIGGLGIHLVRQIMDEISYERKDNKNILTLIKKL